MTALLLTTLLACQDPVDFARDVRPLFARRCLECHGPAKQKGGLRLDVRGEALRGGDNGPALAPGGHLWVRVNSADPDEKMPPKGDRLTAAELDLLRRWLAAGAPWPEDASGGRVVSDHWAFQPVRRPAVPPKAKHPIDACLLYTSDAADEL